MCWSTYFKPSTNTYIIEETSRADQETSATIEGDVTLSSRIRLLVCMPCGNLCSSALADSDQGSKRKEKKEENITRKEKIMQNNQCFLAGYFSAKTSEVT